MKTLLAAVLLPLFATVPLYAAESGVAIRLVEVKGAVTARASSTAEWVAVKDGVMLSPGGEAKTGAGASVVLAFSDGNKVHLGPKTTFAVEGATTLKTSLRLFSGRLSAWVKRANKADFTVRHAAGVAAVRGTVFAMEGTDTGMNIQLFEGALDIVDSFGRPSSMSPGQSASVSQTAGLQGISSLPPEAKAPVEPTVKAPPPPATTTAAPPPAESAPEAIADSETATAPTTSPTQESSTTSSTCDNTVSPSSPCP